MNKTSTLECIDFCIDEDSAWMISGDCNALFMYDFKRKETKFIDFIPSGAKQLRYAFIRIFKYENKLVLLPAWANNFVIYNVDERNFIVYDNISLWDGGKFVDAFLQGNKLYCVPFDTEKNVIVINLDNMSIIQRIPIEGIEGKVLDHCYCVDNHMFLCVPETNLVIAIDLKELKSRVITIPGAKNLYGITGNNYDIYLQDADNKKIYAYDYKNAQITGEIYDGEESEYILSIDDNTVLISSIVSPLKKVDILHKKQETIGKRERNIEQSIKFVYGQLHKVDSTIYYYDKISSSFYVIVDGFETVYNVDVPLLDVEQIFREMVIDLDENALFQENHFFSVDGFIQSLC